jgi:hypothetical protein
MRKANNSILSENTVTFKLKIHALDVDKATSFKAHLISDLLSFSAPVQNPINSELETLKNETSLLDSHKKESNYFLIPEVEKKVNIASEISIKIPSNQLIRTNSFLRNPHSHTIYQNNYTGKVLNLLI